MPNRPFSGRQVNVFSHEGVAARLSSTYLVVLLVDDVEIKVCDPAESLLLDDGLLEVADGNVEAIAGDGGIVQVVLELEADRHDAGFSRPFSTPGGVGLEVRPSAQDACPAALNQFEQRQRKDNHTSQG